MRAFGQTAAPPGPDFSSYTVEKKSPSGRPYTAAAPDKRAAMIATLGFLNLTGEGDEIDGVVIYEAKLGGSGKSASEFVASNDAPILAVVAVEGSQAFGLAFGDTVDQVLDVLKQYPAVSEVVFLRDQERASSALPMLVGLGVAAAAIGGIMYYGRDRY